MVIINTTGKINEVWLDKPYGTIIVDCPDTGISWESGYTSGYTDGLAACSGSSCDGIYESGYTAGEAAQKAKLSYTAITENGEYTSEDGFSAVTVNVPSGETINNQTKRFNWNNGDYDYQPDNTGGYYVKKTNVNMPGEYSITPDSGYTGLRMVDISEWIWAGDAYNAGFSAGYDSAATGNPGYDEGYEVGFDEGYTSGVTDQKNKLTSTAITQNGTYTREDGFNSVYVNVPQTGYTQADLDAAFQSGITYQKSLLSSTAVTENGRYTSENGFSSVTVSVDCRYGGTNVLDMQYITSADNQTVNLFMGEMQNDNQYFYAFYSAITYMEIDGVPTLKDPNNIQRSTPEIPGENSYRLYTHTFASAGNHTVRFMMARSFSAATQTGTKYPAFELTDLIFCSNSQDKCPIVTANIGEGYEVLGTGVFQGNTTLTAATIPASVTGITWVTFENSTIKQLTCYGTTPPVLGSNNVFSGVSTLEHIYVPASAVDTYKAANRWSNYASIIEAIQ